MYLYSQNLKVAIFALFILIGKYTFIRCYEYNVSQIIPSYINTSFYSIPGLLFPRDMQIEVSLSRIAGTLIYSIDNHDNQLIVSLSDSNEATLIIEGNKVQSYISIPLLCRCELCRFERLRLRIQMRDKMYIQCNGGQIQSTEYIKGAINKDYPTPKFPKSDKLSAYLWLVNTPPSDGLFPNGEQLIGCIFGVWYDGIEVEMETHGVGNKCPVTCTDGVCNDGRCLETYNGSPLCNCTSSFMNGLYCNDTMGSHNVNVSKPYVFKTIKLSSRSISGDIMELRNRVTSLKVFTMERTLTLRISIDNGNGVIHEGSSSFTQYEREENHILVIEFGEYFVDVKYLSSNTSWKFSRINVNRDLSRQRFTNIILKSGDGLIDMVYKNNLREPRWTDISYDGEKIGSNISINLKTVKCNCTNKPKDMGINDSTSPIFIAELIVAICALIMMSITIILCYYYSRRFREKKRKLETTEKDKKAPMEFSTISMENYPRNDYLYSPRDLTAEWLITPCLVPPINPRNIFDEWSDSNEATNSECLIPDLPSAEISSIVSYV